MKKILLLPLCLLITVYLLTGCILPLGELSKLQSEVENRHEELSSISEGMPEYSFPEYSEEPFESSRQESSKEESREESIPTEDIAELASLVEVRDFIYAQRERGNLSFEFIYTGEDELDGPTIARISAACVVFHTIAGSRYEITLVEYPGERIVKAYNSGDQSDLNSEEKLALKTAVEMVNTARSVAENDYELELMLHDMIAERVNYFDGSAYVSDHKNPPRHLTAVGALLDGKANCQGYADGFYTLASIAGFETGKMNVYNSDGWHIINTIKLDGNWYAVDVTFNDCMANGNEYIPSYRLFNAGKDRILEYVWGEEMEYYPLADKSDKNYFYYRTDSQSGHGYKKAYTDINAMAQDIIDRWLDEKISLQCTMLIDTVTDWELLSNAMERSDTRNAKIKWTIWTYTNGRDTFFSVKFS